MGVSTLVWYETWYDDEPDIPDIMFCIQGAKSEMWEQWPLTTNILRAYDYAKMRAEIADFRTELLRAVMHPKRLHLLAL